MTDDVLTPALIVKAMLAMRDAPPRPQARYIHPDDHRHITAEHPQPVPGCHRCIRAWGGIR